MVKILKNGYEKVFYQRCSECLTDFVYQRYDVKTGKGYSTQFTYHIQCPKCHATLDALFNEYTGDSKLEES